MTHYTKYKCKKCDSIFIDYDQIFYLDSKTNRIKIGNKVALAIEESESSPLVGNLIETYCGNCNKKIFIYEINPFESTYGVCVSIDLLQENLKKQYKFIQEKYSKARKLDDLINLGLNVDFYDYILENEEYFMELIDELIDYNGKYENLKLKVNEMIKTFEYYIDLHENSIIVISIIYGSYFFDLDGNKFQKDLCPECLNKISYISEEEICPLCGGELTIEDKIYLE